MVVLKVILQEDLNMIRQLQYIGDVVYITNFKQACAYISDGVKPVDIKYDLKRKVMVFIFRKSETGKVWNKWNNGEYKELFSNV